MDFLHFLENYWGYILPLILFLLSLAVNARINSVYETYASHTIQREVTGREAAEIILYRNDIFDVHVAPTKEVLKNTYQLKKTLVSLSIKDYNKNSIAAVASAAHEAVHAIQFRDKNAFINLLAFLMPISRMVSIIFFPILILATALNLTIGTTSLFYIFIGILTLQLTTIPVEFSANKRALSELSQSGILNEEELYGAYKLLRSTAFVSVAAVIISLTLIFKPRIK